MLTHSNNSIGFLLGYGNGTFKSPAVVVYNKSNSDPSPVSIADFNGDTYLDMAVANGLNRNIDLLLGSGKASFVPQKNDGIGLRSEPHVITPGDFNNDKRFEIVVGYEGTDIVDVFALRNNGSFQDQITYSTGSLPSSVAVGDFNNDTQLDIVVANRG